MNKLKQLMKKRGWTQASLAASLDICERQVRRYLVGDAKIPKTVWMAITLLEIYEEEKKPL